MARKEKKTDREVGVDGFDEDHMDFVSDEEANLSMRNSLREKINSDVEAFLASGGTIESVDPNVVSDPPRKPESNYGGQPI